MIDGLHGRPIAMCSVKVVVTCFPQAYKAEARPCLQSTCKLTKRRRGNASRAHAKFARAPMPACSECDPFPSRAKKTSPLYPPKPPPGCGQPAPPLQRWRLRNTVLKQEGNDFFAPRNLSPTRLRWQPTLHRLGVRGCGTASMEGTFFFARDGLGCDGVALLSSCVCCVGHGCWQELPMGATHSI